MENLLEESLKNLANYRSYEIDFYTNFNDRDDKVIHPFYTVHKFLYGGFKLGIMAMNTVWRAIDSQKDRGILLHPISFFKEAIGKLNTDTDFRILSHHHPIADFQYWNASDLKDLIRRNFHLSFSGHIHKQKLSSHMLSDGGIFSCGSAATLALDGTINGYTLIIKT